MDCYPAGIIRKAAMFMETWTLSLEISIPISYREDMLLFTGFCLRDAQL